MSDQPTYPPKPRSGDRIAVVSPGFAGPGAFPLPHELGLRRLREEFGLEPVEYPATRKLGATPAERAAVLRALDAYAPDTMAVFDVDLGHTEPQLVIPYGGRVRVDGPARRITVTY
ncbi:hypothetical protein [Kitasatospora sp. YST-16]|uniref:hypothetical protein n=1 Tax=Kitasatospora sp. YST-16 TaxID=2998080 RepID=UPI003FA37F14